MRVGDNVDRLAQLYAMWAFLVFFGRHMGNLFKNAIEMLHIAEAAFHTDIYDGLITVQKLLLGL